MTATTSQPIEGGTAGPLAAVPVNGVAVPDVRTLRRIARAEQERLSADAEVERRARAARLDLELREQRREAARREREAETAEKRARVERRRERRAVRRARLRAAAPRWADGALFVLPIMFPMAVAWVGQIRFAMTVMGWPLAAAVVFAAGFELSTAYVARLDWLSRAAGDSALLFRGATWGFAAGAATMNYWHAAGPGFAPNGEAVSYGLMSVTGVVLWELLSTYRHRTALRAEGKRPAARPRFGLARWVWFARLTWLAWLLALRDGHTTIDLAWKAALSTVDRYGSAKDARKAVRSGRPVPRPQPLGYGGQDADETPDRRDTGHREGQREVGASRHSERDAAHRDSERNGTQRDSERDAARRDLERDSHVRDGSRESQREERARAQRDPAIPGADDLPEGDTDEVCPNGDSGARQDLGESAVSARMLAYARRRLAEGVPVTGADLDRRFGTRDYGRKVLRRLAAGSPADRERLLSPTRRRSRRVGETGSTKRVTAHG